MSERRHRAHRIVTPKMVVASLVVGVLLAVASVPVAAVVLDARVTSGSVQPITERRVVRDHSIVTTHCRTPTGTIWLREIHPRHTSPALIVQYGDRPPRPSRFESVPRNLTLELDGQRRSVCLLLVGWPFESAYGLRRLDPGAPKYRHVGVLYRGWPRLDFGIPYLPYWPGLLGNTLFYATPVFAALVGLRFWRTHRRRKRGRCVACGYELGDGVDVCPECGLAAASGAAGGPARGTPDRS